MVVLIEGCYTPLMKKVLFDAANYFGTCLFSKPLAKNIEVRIVVSSNMREHGMCSIADYNASNKPRCFDIEVRKKKSIKSMVQTLAHEMVHVKQFATNEMNEMDSTWKGKRVNLRKLTYIELPWEAEAFEREHELLSKYTLASGIDFKQLDNFEPMYIEEPAELQLELDFD